MFLLLLLFTAMFFLLVFVVISLIMSIHVILILFMIILIMSLNIPLNLFFLYLIIHFLLNQADPVVYCLISFNLLSPKRSGSSGAAI